MPIPDDRCQRCTHPLDGEVYRADRDRVCGVCAGRARDRGEAVERVCPVCHGEPFSPVDGPDGQQWPRACGACTPPPFGIAAQLADGV